MRSLKNVLNAIELDRFFAGLSILLLAGILAAPAVAGPDRRAKNAFKNGDFDQAARILSSSLRGNDDHQDNIKMMQESLKLGQAQYIREAKECVAVGDWDCAFEAYQKAKLLSDLAASMPPVYREVKANGHKEKREYFFEVVDVVDRYAEARDSALVLNYARAKGFEQSGRPRDAALSFKQVLSYDPHYRDAQIRYEAARNEATIQVAIMPFDNVSGKRYFGPMEIRLTDEVVGKAVNDDPEFAQFVTRDYLHRLIEEQGLQQSDLFDPAAVTELGRKVGVRVFVFGKILSVIEDYPPAFAERGRNSTQVSVGDGKKTTVFAEWQKHGRVGEVRVTASFQVIDVETGAIVAAEQETASGRSEVNWVDFKGDRRALPAEIARCGNDRNVRPSPPELLLDVALTDLSQSLAARLSAVFEHEGYRLKIPQRATLSD